MKKRYTLGKKGVVFSIMAVLIVVLIVSLMSTKQKFRYREKSLAIATRIRTMNEFIDDFEKDIDRALYIGGYRALLSMNSYVKQKEGYVENFNDVFKEIILNGTVPNVTLNLMSQGGVGADINSWVDRMNEEANEFGIIINFTVNDVSLNHIDPWTIKITLEATTFLEDSKGLASWNITDSYTQDLSIIGFEDPLYLVETEDKVSNLINITPNLDFVDEADNNNTGVLETHLLEGYYVESNDAPSYLMRFEGNFSSSPYGIESMVNLDDLDKQNIPLLERSVIDYIYFYNTTTTDYCNVKDMPTWFRIDSGHLSDYEITNLGSLCT